MTKEVELGDKGRVVIPLEIRKKLEVEPGDKIMFIEVDGEIVLTTRARVVKRLRGRFKTPGRSLTDELLQERREEAANSTQVA
jgi:AbrB family looped-hinge helix DNA binding protein